MTSDGLFCVEDAELDHMRQRRCVLVDESREEPTGEDTHPDPDDSGEDNLDLG